MRPTTPAANEPGAQEAVWPLNEWSVDAHGSTAPVSLAGRLEMSLEGLRKAVGWDAESQKMARALAAQRAALARRDAAALDAAAAAPPIVRAVERTLEERGHGRCIFRVPYRAALRLTPDELRAGELEHTLYLQAEVAPEWNLEKWLALRETRGVQAFPLSARVVGADARAAPFDTLWTLQLTRAAPLDDAAAPAIVPRTVAGSGEDVCRFERSTPYACTAREHWAAGTRRPAELLNDPVHCDEPALGVEFTSIDAVGFDAARLVQNVARRTHDNRSFIVPLSYAYCGLLRRVHAASTIAQLRAARTDALQLECEPPSSYTLPRTQTHLRIGAAQLDAAVKFIEQRLAPANVPYDVGRLCFAVTPFDDVPWVEAWQAALASADAARAADAGADDAARATRASAPVHIELQLCVYFVALSPAGIASPKGHAASPRVAERREYAPPVPLLPTSAALDDMLLTSGTTTAGTESARLYHGTSESIDVESDDDDDDDDDDDAATETETDQAESGAGAGDQ